MFGLRRCSGSVDVRAPSRSRRAGPSDRRASRARGRRRSAYEAPNGTGDRDAADRRRRIEAEPVPPRPRTRRLASRSNAAPASRSATLLGAGLGLRLLALAHDQHLLTVHLDGAPVARCLARGLGSGAALAPLPELLLQVLEHPAPPAGYCRCTKVSSARARFGLRSLRSALASICRMRSRVTAKRCPTSSRV